MPPRTERGGGWEIDGSARGSGRDDAAPLMAELPELPELPELAELPELPELAELPRSVRLREPPLRATTGAADFFESALGRGAGSGRDDGSRSPLALAAAVLATPLCAASRVVAGTLLETGGITTSRTSAFPHEPHAWVPSTA